MRGLCDALRSNEFDVLIAFDHLNLKFLMVQQGVTVIKGIRRPCSIQKPGMESHVLYVIKVTLNTYVS